MTKLINQDQVHAMIGEVASSKSLAAAPHRPAGEGADDLAFLDESQGHGQVGDYIFRVCFIDPFQGEVMAKFAANTLKAKTAAILLDLNSDYSQGLTQFFKASFTNSAGRSSRKSYTQTRPRFHRPVDGDQRRETGCDLRAGLLRQVGVIAKQAKQLGITAPLLGGTVGTRRSFGSWAATP